MESHGLLSFNMVTLKSETSDRVTVYFSQFPNVIVDADSVSEGRKILIATLNDYLNCQDCFLKNPDSTPENLTTSTVAFNCVEA